ncbi:titin isoform X1 [Nasonia vitripennis]|uniref:LisH domain-containing protein n=1 Tax=Nasonia vitripennis TaxID=7425 RepID=A0A7M7LKN9_NASVI|nr:titin isoform X1 [Nasonia vitripennis]
MDSLLPSEIARLVLGYLQEQKCEGAAKTFLETSPLLQECHLVAQRGGKYSTKVGGLNLMDILEKYCAVNAMVQEKLSRVTDNETLRHSNDLLDQLRYLLDGSSSSRGHRFVVNISVPSQSSPSGPLRSPIISGSNRKRHHSSSERGKRISRTLSNMMDKNAQNTVTQSCDTVEATPLESLPGHKASTKQNDLENQINTNDKYFNKIDPMIPAPKIPRFDVPSSSTTNTQPVEPSLGLSSKINVHSNYKDQGTEAIPIIEPLQPVQTPSKCTSGTNTDELMNYCTAEVQTGPCDIIESESDINDEPIENLSMLTKKLLQRTELHKRIAENINKAIMPVETPLREDNVCEHPTEANLSLLNDFDTTIKSIVQATETDPVFEDFLNEIFKVGETDTSPDEDSDGKNNKISNNENYPQNTDMIGTDHNCEVMEPIKLNEQKTDGSEVPLKQRLRSSFRSQNTNIDEEDKDTNSLLENQNAEAIMSIVNVVTSKRNSLASSEEFNGEFLSIEPVPENPVVHEPQPEAIVEPEVKKSEDKIKPSKSTTKKTKKPKPPKPIPEPPEVVPTLILCSEKDVESLMHQSQSYMPIAPKPDEATPPIAESAPKIYLRTVNVPRHLINPTAIELSKAANPQILQMLQQQVGSPQKAVGDGGPIVSSATSDQIVVPIAVTDEKHRAKDGDCTTATSAVPAGCVPGSSESITLYGGAGDATEMKVSPISSMPIISLDDSTIGLTAGTGLSPYFKDHIIGGDSIEADSTKKDEEMEAEQVEVQDSAKESENPKITANTTADTEDDCPEPVVLQVEPDEEELAANALEEKPEEKQGSVKSDNVITTEIIAKHTPRTLLRSRAKNNRLSLSTPRRRNSHVRALDFNTPMKHGTARKVPQSCTRSKSVCRAGLFKSPPFTGATPNVNINLLPELQPIVKKVRTIAPMNPIIYPQVPIATRSPAPKLQGNWAKYTGIGMILGETSTSESSPEKTPQQETAAKIPAPIPELAEESIEEVPEKKAQDLCVNNVEKPISEKKSWDSDLRRIVGAQVIEEESKSRTRKFRRASIRKKGSSASKATKSDAPGDGDAKDKTQDQKTTKDNKKTEPDSKNAKTTDDDNANEPIDKINTSVEVGTETAHKTEITPPSALPVSKKPHLEGLSVSKSNVENDKNVKNSTIPKNSPVNVTITRFPDMLDLETPRKTEVTIYVPPTPRLLVTPGDGLKINKSKVDLKIKDCVDTPDFPKTPCIVVTPKIVEEEDNDKKPSPYYEPEDEQPAKFKEIVTEKVVMQVQETTTVTIQKNVIELQENKSIEITEYGVIEENMNQKDQDEQTKSEDNSKEIVEETSIEEANVSANSSANSYSDSDDDSSDSDSSSSSSSSNSSTSSTSSNSSGESSPTKSVIREATEVASQISPESSPTKSVIKEATETVAQIDPASSPIKSIIQEPTEAAIQSSPELSPNKSINQETTDVTSQSFRKDFSMTESEINSPERLMQNFSNIGQEELDRLEAISRENSPTKVFSVTKEPSDDEVKETPAKQENMIEAVIGDTPSVTDAERALRRDSLTNLTSKISAIITTSQSDRSLATSSAATSEESCVTSTGKSGLKIKSIENVAPNDLTKKVSEMLHLEIQKNQRLAISQRKAVVNNIVIDAKLSQQLEEKRLRMLAKLNGQKSPKVTGKGKKLIATKKSAETEKFVSSTTDNRKDKTKQQIESDKLVYNSAKNVEKSKSGNVKLADKKTEEAKESRKGKSKASLKKKTAQNDQLSKTEVANNEANLKKAEKGAMKSTAKETSVTATTITITAENVKQISKSKVDQVKRDLFSDEEINDQRTTRSQTARRTTSDGQKNSNAGDRHDANAPFNNSKEELPGVLECLQLIPANKSDHESGNHDLGNETFDNCGPSNSQSNVQDISIVYDESVPIKKRKRQYSTGDLETTYSFTFPEEGITQILTLTECSELFKMTPKYGKPKATSSPKKSPTKVKKSNIKILEKPPMPTSALNARVGKLDERKKKVCKRKTTPIKEDQVVEKKTKVDPQALFKKIKVDEFLKLVHE